MTAKPPLTEYPIYEDEDDATVMAMERRLWWIAGRKNILRRILDRAVAIRSVRRILDIGCGSGNSFDLLAPYGQVIGCDSSPVQVRRARSRGIAAEVFVTEGDLFEQPFGEPFQLTCLFDVMEHMDDHAGFLARLNARVETGHLLLVSVPACPAIYGPHDRLLEHFRRYKLKGLEELLASRGFRVIWSNHFVTLLFPFIALLRLIEKWRDKVGKPQEKVNIGNMPGWVNPILRGILAVEAVIANRVPLPFGLWAIVLAEKIEDFVEPHKT
jgi:SAM-dependent methyltransferase